MDEKYKISLDVVVVVDGKEWKSVEEIMKYMGIKELVDNNIFDNVKIERVSKGVEVVKVEDIYMCLDKEIEVREEEVEKRIEVDIKYNVDRYEYVNEMEIMVLKDGRMVLDDDEFERFV